MTVQTVHQESWPVWAKLLVVLVVVLGITATLPWLFMATAMAANCSRMMGGMPMPGMPLPH